MGSKRDGMNTDETSASGDAAIPAWAEALFRAKEERRRELACLPIEEKIKIIVEMQKMVQHIPTPSGEPRPKPWAI